MIPIKIPVVCFLFCKNSKLDPKIFYGDLEYPRVARTILKRKKNKFGEYTIRFQNLVYKTTKIKKIPKWLWSR